MKTAPQLTVEDYTRSVRNILSSLEKYKEDYPEQFLYSDVVDEDGNQYINLVMEGGGVHGVALVGFTYILEKMGIRFLSLGGTSAGSINAILLASKEIPSQPKSEIVLERLASKNFYDFVDGGWVARWLMRSMVKGGSMFGAIASGGLNFIRMILTTRLGLNPGMEFEKWLDEEITQNTVSDLLANMNHFVRAMYIRDDKGNRRLITDKSEIQANLAIIAADITTETKVEFPSMGELYFEKYENMNPAKFVRASMSVPGFFAPVRLDMRWAGGRELRLLKKWREKTGYVGNHLPKEVLLVDGGIMSNFPIDVFHNDDNVPNRPTIGVKLGLDRCSFNSVNSIIDVMMTCFGSARSIRDYEFLNKHGHTKDCVAYIDVDGVSWLDFNLPPDDRLKLFINGARAAEEFLRRFDWHRYRRHVKEKLISRTKASMWEMWDEQEVLFKIGLNERRIEDKKVVDFLRKKIIKSKTKPMLLWIDDNYLNDAFELNILEKLNFKCWIAHSSAEAEAMLKKHGQKVKIIISDCNREGSPYEGVSFCYKIQDLEKNRFQKLPVIIRSGSKVNQLRKMELPPHIFTATENWNPLILKDLVLKIYDILSGDNMTGTTPTTEGKAKSSKSKKVNDIDLQEKLVGIPPSETVK